MAFKWEAMEKNQITKFQPKQNKYLTKPFPVFQLNLHQSVHNRDNQSRLHKPFPLNKHFLHEAFVLTGESVAYTNSLFYHFPLAVHVRFAFEWSIIVN